MNGNKTYLAAAGTVVAFLSAKFGLDLSPDVQQAIVVIGLALMGAALRHGVEKNKNKNDEKTDE